MIEIQSKRVELKTAMQLHSTESAHNIWSRMVSLWETKPAIEAITEMALLLVKEGWNDR